MSDSDIVRELREILKKYDHGENIIRESRLVRSEKEFAQAMNKLKLEIAELPDAQSEIKIFKSGELLALRFARCMEEGL